MDLQRLQIWRRLCRSPTRHSRPVIFCCSSLPTGFCFDYSLSVDWESSLCSARRCLEGGTTSPDVVPPSRQRLGVIWWSLPAPPQFPSRRFVSGIKQAHKSGVIARENARAPPRFASPAASVPLNPLVRRPQKLTRSKAWRRPA